MQKLKLTKKYDRYSEYKDSEVDFLGNIPKSWSINTLKSLSFITNGKSNSQDAIENGSYPFFDRSTQIKSSNQYLFDGNYIILPGEGADFIVKRYFGKFDLHQRAYAILPNINKVSPEFLYFHLIGKRVAFDITSVGSTVKSLRLPLIKMVPLSIPPHEIQIKIANYLNLKTSLIDQIIEKKQKMIELLEEKKVAVINNTITKGLDKNPQFINSNVEWIGKIPKGWEVKKVRTILKEHRQGYYTQDDYVDEGIKLLRITDFNEFSEIKTQNCPKVSYTKLIKDFFLKKGDFVFARTGGAGTFGYVDHDDENLAYASYLIRFRFNKDVNTNFLRWYFLSNLFKEGVKSRIHGGVNQNVHAEDIKEQKVPIPKIKEQEAIANYLNKKIFKNREAINSVNISIDLLKEFKLSLISNVVTGKIKIN